MREICHTGEPWEGRPHAERLEPAVAAANAGPADHRPGAPKPAASADAARSGDSHEPRTAAMFYDHETSIGPFLTAFIGDFKAEKISHVSVT